MRYKQKQIYRRKRSYSGVPLNYVENWAYRGHWREKPVKRLANGKKLWKFRFDATKNRKATSYGSMGKGTIGLWRINAIQRIEKTNKGQYQTRMIGTKIPIYFKVKKPYKKYKRRYYK